MRKCSTPLLIGSLCALAWLTAGPASAQIKLPIFEPDESQIPTKGVGYEPAKERSDFKHGAQMRVTLKDGRTVQGTFVRADRQANRLYIRTEPGALPTAVNVNDLKAEGQRGLVEVAVTLPEGKPPVKEAGMAREPIVQEEIFTTTIDQGPMRTHSFSSSVLSPQEKSVLQELESAEQEVARLETLALMARQDMLREDTILSERLRTQRLLNTMLAQQIPTVYSPMWGLYAAQLNPLPYYGSFYRTPLLYPGYAPPFVGTTGLSDYTALAAAQAAASTPVAPTRPPEVTAESLAKARERLAAARSRAIYEDGQIVAVMYETEAKKEK